MLGLKLNPKKGRGGEERSTLKGSVLFLYLHPKSVLSPQTIHTDIYVKEKDVKKAEHASLHGFHIDSEGPIFLC